MLQLRALFYTLTQTYNILNTILKLFFGISKFIFVSITTYGKKLTWNIEQTLLCFSPADKCQKLMRQLSCFRFYLVLPWKINHFLLSHLFQLGAALIAIYWLRTWQTSRTFRSFDATCCGSHIRTVGRLAYLLPSRLNELKFLLAE